jgi:GntR family transcriptional regulator/MocR family aminotransferase
VLRDKDKELLNKSEAKGVYALRVEIARYLKAYRGISCHPEQIVVGAGSEYLINLIIQLLDKAKRYAVENPGYHKIARIISSYGIDTEYLPLDEFGVNIDRLIYSKADVMHISPSHQFPTGITTPVKRRYELLQWAANSNGYIIEDDYDSEFRYTGKPVPALQSLDVNNRVIYMNTFTKSLAPSLRISYMVLPPDLMYKFDKEFTFYSNTVSCFEQYTLARFMSDGYFERHLNRMRNIYKNRIAAIKEGLAGKNISIKGENIGLHLVLEFDKSVDTSEIVKKAAEKSVHITDINSYYVNGKAEKPAVVLGYTGMDSDNIREAIELLNEIW